jgi:hypothetical protein
MADNLTLSTNIGSGAVLATEDESSVHYQKIKLTASGTGTTADLSHAEDTVHTTGDHGIMSLGVRSDTAASLAGTDGDYTAPIFDSTGRQHVNVGNTVTVGSHAVTNAGTFAVQEDGGALTALQVLDNVVIVDDAAYTPGTTSVSMIGFTFDDSAPDSVDEGDAGAARMSANRNIYTTMRDAAGNERGANINASNQLEINIGAQAADVTIADGGNSITIDGTVTANLSATDNAVLDQIEVNTSYGDSVGAGTEAAALRVTLATDSTGLLSVDDNGGSLTVDNAGTFATQATLQAGAASIGTLGANSGVDIGDVDILSLPASTNTIEVVGDVPHDAAASGNPVLIGSRATADVEALTEVAEADASYIATDLQGVVITRPYIAAQEHVQYHVVNTAGTELAITGLDAGGTGVHNYVTSVIVHNAHASTNGFIQLLDGSGGTVMATFPAPATGGSVINFTQPIKQPTANTALYWDASAAITTLYVTIIGYQGQG